MARWVCNHLKFLSSSHKFQKPIHLRSPSEFSRLGCQCDSILSCLRNDVDGSYCHTVPVVEVNITISLVMGNHVMRTLEKLGGMRQMKIRVYGLEVMRMKMKM